MYGEAKSSWYEEDEYERYKVDVSDERVSLEITDDQQVAVWSHDHSCSLEGYLADAPKPRKDSVYQLVRSNLTMPVAAEIEQEVKRRLANPTRQAATPKTKSQSVPKPHKEWWEFWK